MKIYVTKYALTAGIKEHEAEVNGSMAIVPIGTGWMTSYFSGNDWHMTANAASIRAEKMRVAKIKSLRKQIAKLEAVKF